MKLEGLWTPKEVLSFGEEGAYWRPIQECLADDTLDDEMKMFMSCKLLFDTDGPSPTGPPRRRSGGRRKPDRSSSTTTGP